MLLLLCVIFTYQSVYMYSDIERTDRDNAVVLGVERFQKGLNPHDTTTTIGNILTTGTTSIMMASLMGERHLAFLFWLWVVAMFYTGNMAVISLIIFLLGLPLFQRSMCYRLEELYYGIPLIYYGIRSGQGWLIAVGSLVRYVYLPLLFIALCMKKYRTSAIAGMVVMWALLDPVPAWQNQLSMTHVPSYPLDYSLLIVLPAMLWLNHRSCKHTTLDVVEVQDWLLVMRCKRCGKIINREITPDYEHQ